ncbi:mitochondrial carrier domain-containing protein, partial [Dimargaris cristalligena]
PASKRQASQVGVSTAVVRSLLLKPLYLWYRTPLKLFRPLRVDYLAIARSVPGLDGGSSRLSRFQGRFQSTSLGLITHVVRQNGFDFLPRYVFPPLIANSMVGAVLFTTYAYSLPRFQSALLETTAPSPHHHPLRPTLSVVQMGLAGAYAGALAGVAQTLVAVPCDNLKARFQMADLLSGKYPSVMGFVRSTVQQTGLLSLWRGLGLTMTKDVLGFALFFGLFEWGKQVGFRWFVRSESSSSSPSSPSLTAPAPASTLAGLPFLIQPTCVLLAGALAAFVYQIVDYPLERFHHVLRSDLAHLELHHHQHRFYDTYRLAWRHCQRTAASELFGNSYRRLFYAGFTAHALRALPATSLGFLCFEIVRNALEDNSEPE